MSDGNSELEPIRGRLYMVEQVTQYGPRSAPVSDWVTLQATENDPEYSHAGETVCQRCEAVVTVRLPRASDTRARLRGARRRIITAIAVPLTLVLIALGLLLDPPHFDWDGLIVLGTFLGLFSGVALLVVSVSAIREVIETSPLTVHHEPGERRPCNHFAHYS